MSRCYGLESTDWAYSTVAEDFRTCQIKFNLISSQWWYQFWDLLECETVYFGRGIHIFRKKCCLNLEGITVCFQCWSWRQEVFTNSWHLSVVSTQPNILDGFFVTKPTRCTNFTNLFCHGTLHVSDSSSVHHQEFNSLYTQQWYMSDKFVDSFRAGPGWNILVLLKNCLQTCMTYTIAECTVNKLMMMDKRTVRNM